MIGGEKHGETVPVDFTVGVVYDFDGVQYVGSHINETPVLLNTYPTVYDILTLYIGSILSYG